MGIFTKKLTGLQFFLSLIIIFQVGFIIILGFNSTINVKSKEHSNPFEAGPVTTAPKSLLLSLDQPEDNVLSFESSILISGKTSPSKEILLTTSSEDKVIKSKADGSFSDDVNLVEGENKISVVVFDDRGDSRSTERTVYFSKERI